jgi:hypothetical protein
MGKYKALEYLRAHPKGADVCFMCKPDQELKLEPDYTSHSSDKDGIFPVKKEFHWGAVDWTDVLINGVGIAGDIALGSTVVGDFAGPEIWLATEGVEYIGIARDVSSGDNNALARDGISKAIEVVGDLRRSAILAPAVGFVFNMANIAEAFQEGYEDVPDYGPYLP